MKCICPHCGSQSELGALTEDAEGRRLLGMLGQAGAAAGPLVAYLGLFRPAKQALRWSRALALATEVLSLAEARSATREQLAEALSRTVEALDPQRRQSDWQPLKNHNYLAKVLASTRAEARPRTATWHGRALDALDD